MNAVCCAPPAQAQAPNIRPGAVSTWPSKAPPRPGSSSTEPCPARPWAPRAGSSLKPSSQPQPVSIPSEVPGAPSCATPGWGGGTGLCARPCPATPGSPPCSHCPRPHGTGGPHSALTAFTYISLNSNKLPPPERFPSHPNLMTNFHRFHGSRITPLLLYPCTFNVHIIKFFWSFNFFYPFLLCPYYLYTSFLAHYNLWAMKYCLVEVQFPVGQISIYLFLSKSISFKFQSIIFSLLIPVSFFRHLRDSLEMWSALNNTVLQI